MVHKREDLIWNRKVMFEMMEMNIQMNWNKRNVKNVIFNA